MPKDIQLELIVSFMVLAFGIGVALFLRHNLKKSRKQ